MLIFAYIILQKITIDKQFYNLLLKNDKLFHCEVTFFISDSFADHLSPHRPDSSCSKFWCSAQGIYTPELVLDRI